MNLPGSAMGACRRAEFAGTVTHSVMPATRLLDGGPALEKRAGAVGDERRGELGGTSYAAPRQRGRDAGLEVGDAVALEDAEPRGLAVGGEAHELHG